MVTNFKKLNRTNVPLNPVVSARKHLKADVVASLTKQLKKHPTVISPEDKGTLKQQPRRDSMLATSTMSLSTIKRFDTEDEVNKKIHPERKGYFKFLKV